MKKIYDIEYRVCTKYDEDYIENIPNKKTAYQIAIALIKQYGDDLTALNIKLFDSEHRWLLEDIQLK